MTGARSLFTANLLDRNSRLLVTHVNLLRDAVRDVCARAPFHIDARVVLPDQQRNVSPIPTPSTPARSRNAPIRRTASPSIGRLAA